MTTVFSTAICEIYQTLTEPTKKFQCNNSIENFELERILFQFTMLYLKTFLFESHIVLSLVLNVCKNNVEHLDLALILRCGAYMRYDKPEKLPHTNSACSYNDKSISQSKNFPCRMFFFMLRLVDFEISLTPLCQLLTLLNLRKLNLLFIIVNIVCFSYTVKRGLV